jgi:lysophospholipase L1-like esterase
MARAALGGRPRLLWREQLIAASRDPFVYKSLALFVFAIAIWLWNAEAKVAANLKNKDLHQMLLDHPVNTNSPAQRCIDSDDGHKIPLTPCRCGDPLKPVARAQGDWAAFHRRMVAAAREGPVDREVNVVLLGDSITEHWNGTSRMGTEQLPGQFRAVFEKHFDLNSHTAQVEGMALACSGDTTTELLWHLQNGVLDDMLQPKVWVLLIGTNDLGRWGCSKRTVLAAILNVAQFLHERRPKASIIIHGLLPRSDHRHGSDPVSYTLSSHWKDIMFINRELKFFCSVHPGEWSYMEASRIFLKKKAQQPGHDDTEGALEINADMMTDALHPSGEGMELWAPLIVEQVMKRIHEQEKKAEKGR